MGNSFYDLFSLMIYAMSCVFSEMENFSAFTYSKYQTPLTNIHIFIPSISSSYVCSSFGAPCYQASSRGNYCLIAYPCRPVFQKEIMTVTWPGLQLRDYFWGLCLCAMPILNRWRDLFVHMFMGAAVGVYHTVNLLLIWLSKLGTNSSENLSNCWLIA